MSSTEILKTAVQTAIAKIYPEQSLPDFSVTRPELETHGDYTVNAALILAKRVGEPPLLVAEKLTAALVRPAEFEKVAVAAPGFINFFLKNDYLFDELRSITGQTNYGHSKVSNDRVMIEFGQPNTHKMPHIGHLFSYCYGESAARLLEATGRKTFRQNYQGDVGPHVAKCLWAYQGRLERGEAIDPTALLFDKVTYLQTCYQEGALAYEEEPSAKAAIDALNQKIYAHNPAIYTLWQETRQWSLDYYASFEAEIGARFQVHYFESETSVIGEKIVRAHIGDVFEESDGAIIFRGEPYGLHTRVFINQKGHPTYEAKDIGLITKKLELDFNFDEAIYTTGNEQSEYFRVVFKAIELLYPETKGKLRHIGYGMLNLTSGKMSSRTGNIVTASTLIAMVKERVTRYLTANRDYAAAEIESIAELVALGAIKYSFLKSAAGKNMSFDLESSVAFEGNSGPYLQYTYARCQSVLRKAPADAMTVKMMNKLTPHADELAVLRYLTHFPEVVVASAEALAPHLVCSYLFELAQRYSYFYNQHQILSDDQPTTTFRRQLTAAVAQVLKNGLNLLGIDVREKI